MAGPQRPRAAVLFKHGSFTYRITEVLDTFANWLTQVSPRRAARRRMRRYVSVLTQMAAVSSPHGIEYEWETYPFQAEFLELQKAGFVTGEIGTHCKGPQFSEGTTVLFMGGITVSGIGKLADLTDYLWRTSAWGTVTDSLVKFAWLAIGILLGYVCASLVGSGPPTPS
jgi:hypothetical protein